MQINSINTIVFFGINKKSWLVRYIKRKLKGKRIYFIDASAKYIPSKVFMADAISGYYAVSLDSNFLSKFRFLKLIASMSTGVDHIDIDYCKKNGIAVLNVPNYCSNTVAEYTICLLLALMRKIPQTLYWTKSKKLVRESLEGNDLQNKVIGIIGTGHIGQHVISIARSIGMNVIAYDRRKDRNLSKRLGFKYVSFNSLIKKSDIISVHVPLTPNTYHMLNDSVFKQMKSSAVLINTSRGDIIDTYALYNALVSKRIAGAALDVIEQEKLLFFRNTIYNKEFSTEQKRMLKKIKRLLKMKNVIITPHNAFNTREAVLRLVDTTMDNILSYERGIVKNEVLNHI